MEFMYRTESYSGSGIRDLKDVMFFEIFELENTDILETQVNDILDEDLKEKIEKILSDDKIFLSLEEPDIELLVEELIIDMSKRSGRHLTFALWLADYDVVRDPSENGYGQYLDNTNSDIDKYCIKNGFVVSNLGKGGKLFAFDKPQKPREIEITPSFYR